LTDTPLPEPDQRLHIFRVREHAQLKTAGAILSGMFYYDLFTFGHYTEIMDTKGVYFYLAEYDGLPVGACMAQHGDCFVNISWVGVLGGYRKRGIAGYLIQTAEKEAYRCGKTIGTIHGGTDVAGAYRRVGYKEYVRGIDAHFIEPTPS
jgi:GNAT superfamily N-acetyltransferase